MDNILIKALIKLFWEICVFRAGPQNVPDSIILCLIATIGFTTIYLIQFMFIHTTPVMDFPGAFIRICYLLSSIALFSYLLMLARHTTPRYLRTLTAIIATQTLLSFFILPMMLLASVILYPEQDKVLLVLFGAAFFVIMVILNVWHLMITAHIYRNALNVSFFGGMLMSIGLMTFTLLIVKSLGN